MLHRLKKKGIGCKIGVHFIGALAYADDVILLCPSRKGLQEMIDVCEYFGDDFCVNFKAKKTQCFMFCLNPIDLKCTVKLNGEVLK